MSDGDRQIVLAGDASYLERTMLSGTIDGISANEAVAQSTLAEIRALCAQRPTIYLPAHDPQSADRLQERQIVVEPQQAKSIIAAGASEPKIHPAPANGLEQKIRPKHLCCGASHRRNFSKPKTLIDCSDPQGDLVMPILIWIAFWSNVMGIAAGWQETALPIRVRAKDRRDHSAD